MYSPKIERLNCQAQPQLQLSWAELVLIPIPPADGDDDGDNDDDDTRNSTFHQLLSKAQKTKFISLYEETPKQFFNPTPTPKIAHQGPKKSKMTQKSSQYQKSEFKEL